MCYNPYDHDAMLRDVSDRTAGVEAPNLRLALAFGVLARLVAKALGRSEPANQPAAGSHFAAE